MKALIPKKRVFFLKTSQKRQENSPHEFEIFALNENRAQEQLRLVWFQLSTGGLQMSMFFVHADIYLSMKMFLLGRRRKKLREL